MIRQDFTFPDKESRAEEIGSHFRRASLKCINGFAIAVFQRPAIRIDPCIAQAPSRVLIIEPHGYMQQAHAWCIRSNHLFRGVGLAHYTDRKSTRLNSSHGSIS